MSRPALHLLARRLRSIAFVATGNTGRRRIPPSEYAVLEDVALHPGSSIRDITERTAITQSLVSRIVARFREQQLLTTAPDPDDGRHVLVTVEPGVTEDVFRARGRAPIDHALGSELPHLSPDRRRRLIELLDELANLIDVPGPTADPGAMRTGQARGIRKDTILPSTTIT
ncbi:MarR family transcriptional regulator [Nocardia sp. NPDC004568]|uniref:MarR family winged helix-turn-helix transcriptional regulator n=1 Tax=Nocardia sp. NPDC004568 TaxID=3154551 RepID=UPI0033AC0335